LANIRRYMTMFYVWGSVVGPVITSAVWDTWHTYEPMLWGLVAMFMISGIFYSQLGRPWMRPKVEVI
jgi:hypothetical protein